MSVKSVIIVSAISILLIGCAGSAKKINNLSIGMTKAAVIEVMGEPDYTSGAKDVEILSYKLTSNSLISDTYFVRIKEGKVERFGQQGSFGSFY